MALKHSAFDRGHFKGIARVSSVGTASVLALLIATSVLPPLVSDQSDRAVMNAPTILLTSPIAGDIGTLDAKPGLAVDRGAVLAEISNTRVDRSTAIQLDASLAQMRAKALATARKGESNQAYLASLDKTIEEKTNQLDQILNAQISELKAKVAEADAVVESRRLAYRQVDQLATKNIANADTRKPARQQYDAAVSAKEAAEAKLQQKVSQLEGLSKGIYVGDDLLALAELAQKRRDIAFDSQRLAIEEKELQARIEGQTHLLDAENRRLDSLAHVTVTAPMSGEIFSLSASRGRRVNAGDTLAKFVDCSQRFVVAIFSYRKAPDLTVGTRVEISGLGSAARGGTVAEILPKASDKSDDLYAVPFPQTERRELYVLVRPDPEPVGQLADDEATSSCGIGRWVTVTRANGWIPSTSVVWREIESHGARIFAEIFDVEPAAAVDLKRYAHRERRR